MDILDSLIELMVKEGASDLHLSEGRSPYIRIYGELIPLTKVSPITNQVATKLVHSILPEQKKEIFDRNQSADFAYVHSKERFRAHIFVEQQRMCLNFRHIQKNIPTLSELKLPESIGNFARSKSGFFLAVGPTGQGKSTTLASLVEIINKERVEKIVTIEDPIEYMFVQDKSMIHQREVGLDTPNFHQALTDSFRQDINVLMVGEIRDSETMATAVTAAETGHLVFSTLHTNNAAQTVERIIDSFPPNQQNQIRIQLAASLSGIFSQRLIPRISGGLVPAYELLINNTAVANLIRDNRTHELNTVIETGTQEGMIDFNRCLSALVQNGDISIESAYLYSQNPKSLEKML
jgi:twitching motility protein PilT